MKCRTRNSIEANIDKVMKLGYYVVGYTEYHFRIQDRVDFWPSTGKWFDPKGYKPDNRGIGLKTLLPYLKENYPLVL